LIVLFIKTMKQTICSISLATSLLCCGLVWAAGPNADTTAQPTPEQLQLLQNKADQIVKRCVAKAMLIREERVCEAKKSAILFCLSEESKTKDIDKALQICERNYVL
jgi:hypothetical protein